uniref:C-C motif chemokine 19-like n=1 Tax=Pristiophorus japonicus TaxID=55135 RepID=UPI00398F857D
MGRATFSTTAFLFLVSAVLWSWSQASDDSKSLQDCCLATGSKPIPSRIVKSYTIQLPQNGCKIHAVLFLTKHKKQLCAPPTEKWVRKLMDKINKKFRRPKSIRGRKPKKSQNKKRRQA